jgi:uronate dehydrogenase
MGKTFSLGRSLNPPPRYPRILLTGAAGGLGRVLRPSLKPCCDVLRVSDREPLGAAGEGEEVVECDLADREAVLGLVEGVDAIAHFGGISVEAAFEPILRSNIEGTFNVYDAARRHGVKRIVFASSNHVIGFYKQTQRIDAAAPMRPDSLYGVSKGFGENLSRYYFDRHGIETVCLRIGSSFPQVKDRRMLATYLSYRDLTELVRCSLFAPDVGHTIAFGMSDNSTAWWDNRAAVHLGFRPRDSADVQRARVEAENPQLPPDDPAVVYQGGVFVCAGPFDD